MGRLLTDDEKAHWDPVNGSDLYRAEMAAAKREPDIRVPREDTAERFYLGCFFAHPERAAELFALPIADSDFFDTYHRDIFRTLQEQHLHGGINVELVRARLKPTTSANGDLSKDYFHDLEAMVGTTAYAHVEAAKIVEARKKRQRYDVLQTLAEHSLNGYSSEQIDNELFATVDDWRQERRIKQPQERSTLADLWADYPRLNEPIINGFMRAGEIANVISYSKIGKSWLMYGLGLDIKLGLSWFGKFATTKGQILYIDNELHKPTIGHRFRTVGDAKGIPPGEYSDIEVISLRGRLRGLSAVDRDHLESLEPGEVQAIFLDAKYRFAVAGVSENDNAAETALYNELDRIAERTKAAIILVHHASKGSQTDKRVTDVGSGAGAQSRAADAHLVLREHEEPGVVVLEAAVRSFAPVEPLALRWEFPLWLQAGDVDPGKLKGRGTRTEERQNDKDREGMDTTLTALIDGPASARGLRRKTGFGEYRQERLLDLLVSQGSIVFEEKKKGKVTHHEYRLAD